MAAPLGLSRPELEREARWLLRRLPSDPAELPAALVEVVVSLIESNNRAIAEYLARQQQTEPPQAF